MHKKLLLILGLVTVMCQTVSADPFDDDKGNHPPATVRQNLIAAEEFLKNDETIPIECCVRLKRKHLCTQTLGRWGLCVCFPPNDDLIIHECNAFYVCTSLLCLPCVMLNPVWDLMQMCWCQNSYLMSDVKGRPMEEGEFTWCGRGPDTTFTFDTENPSSPWRTSVEMLNNSVNTPVSDPFREEGLILQQILWTDGTKHLKEPFEPRVMRWVNEHGGWNSTILDPVSIETVKMDRL